MAPNPGPNSGFFPHHPSWWPNYGPHAAPITTYLYTPITEADFRTEEQKQVDDENDLKVEINTFVWSHAPDQMTLGRADELACKILELFIEALESIKSKECASG